MFPKCLHVRCHGVLVSRETPWWELGLPSPLTEPGCAATLLTGAEQEEASPRFLRGHFSRTSQERTSPTITAERSTVPPAQRHEEPGARQEGNGRKLLQQASVFWGFDEISSVIWKQLFWWLLELDSGELLAPPATPSREAVFTFKLHYWESHSQALLHIRMWFVLWMACAWETDPAIGQCSPQTHWVVTDMRGPRPSHSPTAQHLPDPPHQLLQPQHGRSTAGTPGTWQGCRQDRLKAGEEGLCSPGGFWTPACCSPARGPVAAPARCCGTAPAALPGAHGRAARRRVPSPGAGVGLPRRRAAAPEPSGAAGLGDGGCAPPRARPRPPARPRRLHTPPRPGTDAAQSLGRPGPGPGPALPSPPARRRGAALGTRGRAARGVQPSHRPGSPAGAGREAAGTGAPGRGAAPHPGTTASRPPAAPAPTPAPPRPAPAGSAPVPASPRGSAPPCPALADPRPPLPDPRRRRAPGTGRAGERGPDRRTGPERGGAAAAGPGSALRASALRRPLAAPGAPRRRHPGRDRDPGRRGYPGRRGSPAAGGGGAGRGPRGRERRRGTGSSQSGTRRRCGDPGGAGPVRAPAAGSRMQRPAGCAVAGGAGGKEPGGGREIRGASPPPRRRCAVPGPERPRPPRRPVLPGVAAVPGSSRLPRRPAGAAPGKCGRHGAGGAPR